MRECVTCPAPDDTPVPSGLGPGGPIYGIAELIRLRQPDLSSLFTKTTGGRTLNFLKNKALERAIQRAKRRTASTCSVSSPGAASPESFTPSAS